MLPTMAEHNPIQRRDTTPPNPTDRAARTNERKSHLRSLAVAGTLASVGAFTVLAASNTQVTQSTTPPATEQQVQDQVQGLDDGFTQVPDTTATPSQDDFFNQDGSGAQSGTIAPPQPGVGPGGTGPSMSGGS